MTEQIKKTMEALSKNNMKPYFVETKDEAKELALSLMPKGSSVSNGGGETLTEIGLLQAVKENPDLSYIDRSVDPEAMRKAFFADFYLSSTNAVTEDGLLYNVDGNSNRVAALCYGPKEVIIVVGKNKIVKNLQEAKDRVRSIAAPKNTKRLNCETYCKEKGHCVLEDGLEEGYGCNSAGRICCSFLVSGQQRHIDRIKIIIVNEDLGY